MWYSGAWRNYRHFNKSAQKVKLYSVYFLSIKPLSKCMALFEQLQLGFKYNYFMSFVTCDRFFFYPRFCIFVNCDNIHYREPNWHLQKSCIHFGESLSWQILTRNIFSKWQTLNILNANRIVPFLFSLYGMGVQAVEIHHNWTVLFWVAEVR